jgi:hypothetical protein
MSELIEFDDFKRALAALIEACGPDDDDDDRAE